MIASRRTPDDRLEWWYEDLTTELADPTMGELEGEPEAKPDVWRADEVADDEIGRSSEELHEDEG